MSMIYCQVCQRDVAASSNVGHASSCALYGPRPGLLRMLSFTLHRLVGESRDRRSHQYAPDFSEAVADEVHGRD